MNNFLNSLKKPWRICSLIACIFYLAYILMCFLDIAEFDFYFMLFFPLLTNLIIFIVLLRGKIDIFSVLGFVGVFGLDFIKFIINIIDNINRGILEYSPVSFVHIIISSLVGFAFTLSVAALLFFKVNANRFSLPKIFSFVPVLITIVNTVIELIFNLTGHKMLMGNSFAGVLPAALISAWIYLYPSYNYNE